MKIRCLVLPAILGIYLSRIGLAQVQPTTVLQIQIENYVNYYNDVSDWNKLGINPNPVKLSGPIPNFAVSVDIGDIVSVNGTPVKGVFTERRTQYKRSPEKTPGQVLADSESSAIQDRYFEILKLDGTPIGNIIVTGMGGGLPAPGTPSMIADGNFAVVGGTGAFLGVRGQGGGLDEPSTTSARKASMAEDPSNRRDHKGGHRLFILQILPVSSPRVVETESGPAIVHGSDFSPVTAAKPAKSGEVLSLIASGLGPTERPCRAESSTGDNCPHGSGLLTPVNAPVQVTVNGKPAVVQSAGGYLGTTASYQVNFVMPQGLTPGPASLQLTSAWITGPGVTINVQ